MCLETQASDGEMKRHEIVAETACSFHSLKETVAFKATDQTWELLVFQKWILMREEFEWVLFFQAVFKHKMDFVWPILPGCSGGDC